MTPYEILIRGNEDGTFKGAHVLETHDSQPRPIKLEDWPSIITEVNSGTLAKVTQLETQAELMQAQHAAELERVKAELADRNALIESAKTAIKGAIANPDLDDTATVATIAHVVAVAELPAIEKRRLEIEAEIAQKQAELKALTV
jgi:hypothetical protein